MNNIKITYNGNIIYDGVPSMLVFSCQDNYHSLCIRLDVRLYPIKLGLTTSIGYNPNYENETYSLQVDDFEPVYTELHEYSNRFDEHEYAFGQVITSFFEPAYIKPPTIRSEK